MLVKIDFGSDTAKYFREQVQAPWFAYWLKDKGKLEAPEILSFETGSNQWRRYESWPPKDVRAKNLYIRSEGRLSFAPPVPYRNRRFRLRSLRKDGRRDCSTTNASPRAIAESV